VRDILKLLPHEVRAAGLATLDATSTSDDGETRGGVRKCVSGKGTADKHGEPVHEKWHRLSPDARRLPLYSEQLEAIIFTVSTFSLGLLPGLELLA
jgi:hypothetical protein